MPHDDKLFSLDVPVGIHQLNIIIKKQLSNANNGPVLFEMAERRSQVYTRRVFLKLPLILHSGTAQRFGGHGGMRYTSIENEKLPSQRESSST